MKRTVLFGLAIAALAACAPLSGPAPTDSGVEGYVTLGPSCPVMQADNPCPDKPYPALLTILNAAGRSRIGQVQADATGYYRLALAPGQYILHPESPSVMPRGAEITFVVQPHQFTRQDVVYDSGIR